MLTTLTSTGVVEAVPDGDLIVNEVSEVIDKLEPAVPPKVTEVAVKNPVPDTVTVVAPVAGPAAGLTAVTVGVVS